VRRARPPVRLVGALALAAVLLAGTSAEARTSALVVTHHHTYREGVFLVLDALVDNVSPGMVEWAEVAVEFYDFFDELLRVEHAVLRPPVLSPGQRAAFRVATSWTDDVRKIRLRFTWWAGGQQFQNRPEDEPPLGRWR
jgi:hypothetical protein